MLLLGLSVLIVLYITLPSPEGLSGIDKVTYIQTSLRSGACLTTVHPYGRTFGSPEETHAYTFQPAHHGLYSDVAFEWQLSQKSATDSIILQIGHPTNMFFPDLGCRLDITRLANSTPRFLTERCYIWTSAGNRDGFSLPDFNNADAALLYHQSRDTWTDVSIQLLVPKTGIVELWKWSDGWEARNASDIALIDDEDRSWYLIATFDVSSAVQRSRVPQISEIEILFQYAMLPTRTLPVRKIILRILAPLYTHLEWTLSTFLVPGLEFLYVVSLSAGLFAMAYTLVAYAAWSYLGRQRSFGRWCRDFWMTKHAARLLAGPGRPRTWGPKGPLDDEDDEEDRDANYRAPPELLTCVFDFFRSSSPLDDLLVTFNSTRWMVQPLSRRRRSNHRSTELPRVYGKSTW